MIRTAIEFQVSFAKELYKTDHILQKRPIIRRSYAQHLLSPIYFPNSDRTIDLFCKRALQKRQYPAIPGFWALRQIAPKFNFKEPYIPPKEAFLSSEEPYKYRIGMYVYCIETCIRLNISIQTILIGFSFEKKSIYVCISLCMYVYACISLCMYVYACISLCTYMYACISLCVYTEERYVYIHTQQRYTYSEDPQYVLQRALYTAVRAVYLIRIHF